MKKSLIIIVVCLLILSCSASCWAYSDTQSLDTTTQQAIELLSNKGVLNGYNDGSFRPGQYVSRAEFAKISCMLAGYEKSSVSSAPFADVAIGQWYDGWVATAVNQHLIKGYGNGSFRPDNTISEQEILTILVRMSGVDDSNFSWPNDYLTVATSLGLSNNITLNAKAPATRAVCAVMAANWLNQQDSETADVYGIIVKVAVNSVDIYTSEGNTVSYSCTVSQIPATTLPGSFIEATIADGGISEVMQLISPVKGSDSWDVSYGRLEIDDTYYNISDTVFIGAEFAVNKPFTATNFKGAALGDNNKIAAADILYGDQLKAVKVNDGKLEVVYFVNAGLRLGKAYGVIDEIYNSADGASVNFVGNDDNDNGLVLSDQGDVVASIIDGYDSGAYSCCFVQYKLTGDDDNDIEITLSPLLMINNGVKLLSAEALDLSNFDDSWYWILTDGSVSATCSDVASVTSELKTVNRSTSSVTIGSSIYDIDDISTIYVIDTDGAVSSGSIKDLTAGKDTIAIVNDENVILWMFCFE